MGYEIQGQVALVTGANRGIGKAILEGLLKEGAAKVYAAVRDTSSVAGLIDEYGDRVVPVEFDLTNPDLIESAAKTASDVSLVVNNAGVLKAASALSEDALESLDFEMNANVYGLIRVAQAFAPVLKANGGGALVQLNSVASLKTFPDFTTYCASKAASYAVTQALKDQLKEQGPRWSACIRGRSQLTWDMMPALMKLPSHRNWSRMGLYPRCSRVNFMSFPIRWRKIWDLLMRASQKM